MMRAIMIVEVAGLPPDYVKKRLEEHISHVDKMNGVKVQSIKVSEPKEIKDSKGVFTCFAEVEFEAENFAVLSDTIFEFMPSSIEVIEPAKIELTPIETTDLLNNLAGRLHRYDEIAKLAKIKIDQLTKQLEEEKAKKLDDSENKTEKPKN